MNKESCRLAVVGCGRISQVHLLVLQDHPRAELVAVADLDLSAAADVAEAWGCKPFGDTQEMLQDARPEAVILCTPPNTHRDLAVTALQSGAHVLCEKPLTLTVDDAMTMQEAATQAGRHLMMASKFRYVDDIVKTRAIVKSGILGKILSFENEFCAHVDMTQRWNARPQVSGGGVLIDNGTHSVDIVRYLLGSVTEVQAIESVRWQPLEVEDNCRLLCRVEDGTVASIDLSWSIDKVSPWYISIYGSEGMLQVGWQESRYRQSQKSKWVVFGSGYDKFQAVRHQLDNFIGTIRGEVVPLIGSHEAFDSVSVIQAAYRSTVNRSWESVQR